MPWCCTWPGRDLLDLPFCAIELVTVGPFLLLLADFLGGFSAGGGADFGFGEMIFALTFEASLALGWASALLMFGVAAVTGWSVSTLVSDTVFPCLLHLHDCQVADSCVKSIL